VYQYFFVQFLLLNTGHMRAYWK